MPSYYSIRYWPCMFLIASSTPILVLTNRKYFKLWTKRVLWSDLATTNMPPAAKLCHVAIQETIVKYCNSKL